jgi:hypothetical protein
LPCQFLESIRDLKALLTSGRDSFTKYHRLVASEFTERPRGFDNAFPSILKTLLQVGAHLGKESEFKDFFSALVEIIEAFHNCHMTTDHVVVLFGCLNSTLGALLDEITSLKPKKRSLFTDYWTRYLHGLQECTMVLWRPFAGLVR